MRNKHTKYTWWLIIFFALFISACYAVGQEPPITKIPPTALMITSAPTSTNTFVVPTNTSTPSPVTPTVLLPTFSVSEKQRLVAQLLTQDYLCLLPCWGGIKPGVTTWTEAKVFLEHFAQVYSSSPGIYTAEFQYEGENTVLRFYSPNGIIEFIGVPRLNYPLYKLLKEYGKPDEVYFHILDVLSIDTDNPYTVFLFYKERGIIAEYTGASPKGAALSVCFKDSQGRKSRAPFLSLWSTGSNKTFQDVATRDMSKFSDYLSLNYYRLEELSTYRVNDFFEIYKLEQNENKCIKIKNPNPKP